MNALETAGSGAALDLQSGEKVMKRGSLLGGPAGLLVDLMYDKLVDHIKGLREDIGAKVSSSRKLARLTIGQLSELLTDVCDEMGRRACRAETEPFLDIKLEYSPKRNQARQKLADLTPHRFSQLIISVVAELERRFPELRRSRSELQVAGPSAEPPSGPRLDEQFEQLDRSLASLPEISLSSYRLHGAPSIPNMGATTLETPSTTEASSAATLSTPKTLTEPIALAVDNAKGERPGIICEARNSLMQKRSLDERLRCGQTFNFDCLDSLIKDLNAMIGHEQTSEIEQLKQRHAQELASLKEYTKNLEEQVLSAKNHEIARLTARAEELEGRLAMARREHAACAAKVAAKDALIEEQAMLIKTLQTSYMELQNKLASSALVRGDDHQPAQASSMNAGIASSVGVFAATWSAFSKVHEATVRLFENPSISFTERLTALKDACSLTQKLSRDVDHLVSRLDTERMPWISGDIEAVFAAKTKCLQTLSYCLVCCKDMGCGKVHNVDPQMLTAIVDLARYFRALVDAAELVASRAQFPSSPTLPKASSKRESKITAHLDEQISNFVRLVKSRFTRTSVALGSLRVFLEDKNKSEGVSYIELSGKLRQSIADALASAIEVVQMGHQVLPHLKPGHSADVENYLSTLAEGARRLQLCIVDGSSITTDEGARTEAICACKILCSAYYDLNKACISLESPEL